MTKSKFSTGSRETTESEQVPNNLPAQPTPLVGREQDVDGICRLLSQPGVHLLTLVGLGGVGKTRLALQAAHELLDNYSDGVYFIELAPITDPGLVLPTIASALDIRESSDIPLLSHLKEHLQGKKVLLVLDNFEQVVQAGSDVAELLAASPEMKVVVTSRDLLHLYGEHDYPVRPLPLPEPDKPIDLDTLSRNEAIVLFVQRAQAVSPGFTLTELNAKAVAEICRRLDGIPLAIELAAARILVLPPEELLARLDNRLKLLTGGARNVPERQRTLQATLDWSYNLLEPDEQALFRRLGVFVGGATLKAIEQVSGDDLGIDMLDGVTSLVGKSLLQQQEGVAREPRLTMLETIHEYAKEKLRESGDLDAASERHCDYFLHLAEEAEQGMLGKEQAIWLRRLDAEQNNLRGALEWCLSTSSRATEKGLRLAGALREYWDNKSYFREVREGKQWCTELLHKTDAHQESTWQSVERAKVLSTLARMNWQLGDIAEARSNYEQSVEIYRLSGDAAGLADALLGLGSIMMWQGEYDLSRSLYEESFAIAQDLGDKQALANSLALIGVIRMRSREYQAAVAPLDEALAIKRDLGSDADVATTLVMRATVAIHLGEYEYAKTLIKESLGIGRELGAERIIAFCLARLGILALHQGEPQDARQYLMEGLDRTYHSGIRRWTRWYLVGLAEVARLSGSVTHSAKLIGASEGILSVPDANYEPATTDEIERIVANVRDELGEERFAQISAEGRAMTLEEAIAYADEAMPPDSGPKTSGERNALTFLEHQSAYPDNLTEREVEVLRLIAAGKSNQEIAQELVLSRRTAERHVSNIYEKIGASGKVARATATAYALRHGLVT